MTSRILYAAFDLVPSPKGASTHITYFAQGLVEAGYDLTLVTAGDPRLPAGENYYGARLLRVPATPGANFLERAQDFGQFALAQAAKGAFDLVHVRSIWSGMPLIRARAQLGYSRFIYEVNGLPSVELKYHYPAVRHAGLADKLREWEMATLQAADAVVCPARVTADFLVSLGASREKIAVIPNGVDSNSFGPPPDSLSGNDQPLILYVGTLADWQGLDVLVKALPLITAERPVRLALLGRGRKRQRKVLLKMARKLGVADALTIEHAVPHEQVPAWIARADLCVAPLGYNDRNVNQGCCPIKVLEYMAAARPVVAADLPVVRELVCPGGGAYLFQPGDPAGLAEQVLRILEYPDQAAARGRQGAHWVSRRFTWSLAQERLLELYSCLLR